MISDSLNKKKIYLYIHVPFCTIKCPYCNFYSETEQSQERYTNYLLKELNLYSRILDFNKMSLETIYFGGGTPSLLSNNYFEAILSSIYKLWNYNKNIEISIEANPESLDMEKLKFYKSIGCNRLSIGIQSNLDKNLRTLERRHTSLEINKILASVNETDFHNINLDFIFHIPGQEIIDLEQEFHLIKNHRPKHISFYGLILEENTSFSYKYGNFQEEEVYRNMYLKISNVLTNEGYTHYEISNFAIPNYMCRHNMAYWDFSDYLGLGPSASSYIQGKRFKNVSSLDKYILNINYSNLAINEAEVIEKKDILLEKIFLNLRKKEGLNLKKISEEYNFELPDILDKINTYIPENLWNFSDSMFKLTTEGFIMSNSIIIELYHIISTVSTIDL